MSLKNNQDIEALFKRVTELEKEVAMLKNQLLEKATVKKAEAKKNQDNKGD